MSYWLGLDDERSVFVVGHVEIAFAIQRDTAVIALEMAGESQGRFSIQPDFRTIRQCQFGTLSGRNINRLHDSFLPDRFRLRSVIYGHN